MAYIIINKEICLTFALKGNQPTFMWTLKPENHQMTTTYYLPELIRSRKYYLKVTEIKESISVQNTYYKSSNYSAKQ